MRRLRKDVEKGLFLSALIALASLGACREAPAPAAVVDAVVDAAVPVDAAAPETPGAATRAAPLPKPGVLTASLRTANAHGWVAATNGPAHVVEPLGGEATDRAVPIASFTKLWAAVAALQLVAQKKMALTDTVADLLPSLKGRAWADSTLAELMSHTSKVPEFDEASGYFRKRDVSFEDPLAAITQYVPRVTEKRGVFKYRNAEYAIVGTIVAARADKSLPDVLRDEVFARAKMTHSGLLIGAPPADVDLRSLGPVRAQNFFAAGAGYSTPEDLLAFFDALAGDSLLDEAGKALLFDGQKSRGYSALGCWVYTFSGSQLVERQGALGEMRLFSAFLPAEKRAVVAWSSTSLNFDHPYLQHGVGYELARLISDSSSSR